MSKKALYYREPGEGGKLLSNEFGFRKVLILQKGLRFTDDRVNNRRRLNNASLRTKLTYNRNLRLLKDQVHKYANLRTEIDKKISQLKHEIPVDREYHSIWIAPSFGELTV
jgi:hypothetical protein